LTRQALRAVPLRIRVPLAIARQLAPTCFHNISFSQPVTLQDSVGLPIVSSAIA
jgi:hypothetical protein